MLIFAVIIYWWKLNLKNERTKHTYMNFPSQKLIYSRR